MRWTIQSIQEPVFELFEAAIFVGIPDGDRMPDVSIKNWVARGFLSPPLGKRGKKSLRLYSVSDLLRVFVVSSLIRQHTSIEASFICAERLLDRLKDQIKGGHLVTEPEQEYWLMFSDAGSSTEEFTQNERTNFHLAVAYVNERGAFPPLCSLPPHSAPFEEKQETFNADRLIAKFIRSFYRYSFPELFQEKAHSIHFVAAMSPFDLSVEEFIRT